MSFSCERCGASLPTFDTAAVGPCTILAGLGLFAWALSLTLPLASVHLAVGRTASTNLPSALARLVAHDHWILFLAIAWTLLVMPAVGFASVLAVPISARFGRIPRGVKWAFMLGRDGRNWALCDVFILGSMIALLRLQDWGHIDFGPALIGFSVVAVCSGFMEGCLEPGCYLEFWTTSRVSYGASSSVSAASSGQSPHRATFCTHCSLKDPGAYGARCPRCERKLHLRTPDSLQRTWALVVAAALLIIPANIWPVLSIQHMQEHGPKTIYGGVIELMESGNQGLALLVFGASIVVPVLKVAILLLLLVFTQRRSGWRLLLRGRVHRWVKLIGRWSMIDIFASLILYALARFGWFGSVHPERGAIAFCATVFVTMLASESFDSRIMWDRAATNEESEVAA